MKKKLSAAILSVLLLTGCTQYPDDLSTVVNEKLAEVQAEDAGKPYYNSTYYYYYIEPSVGRISSDRTSNILSLDGTKFVMNLNIPSIINSAYYQDSDSSTSTATAGDPVVDTSGSYTDYDGAEHDYSLKIYQSAGTYYTVLSTPYMEYYSVSGKYESANIAAEMLKIARTVRLNEDEVLADFSNRQVISYTRKKLELFQNIAPENGVVDELFADSSNSAGQDSTTGTDNTNNYATDNYPDSGTAEQDDLNEDTPAADTAAPEETASPSATAESYGQSYSEISDASAGGSNG